MSKFKVGEEVLVCISGNVTTIAEVLSRTDHRGNVTTLYRLVGRAPDVLYLDEDLVHNVKPVQKSRVTNEAKAAKPNANVTSDVSPATPDMVTAAVLHSYMIDDEPSTSTSHRHSTIDDHHSTNHSTSHDTYHHSSNDGGSYDSGSSSSSSSD